MIREGSANSRLWSTAKTILSGEITSMCGFTEQKKKRMKMHGVGI